MHPSESQHKGESVKNEDTVENFRSILGISALRASETDRVFHKRDCEPQDAGKCKQQDPRKWKQLYPCMYRNKGLYNRICERGCILWWEFHICKWFIDLCLMAQIAFAATLTALGASRSSHTAVTVFGAINVAIAGVLALLKGQGQPLRLRKELNGLRKIRRHIEDRERMFEIPHYVKVEAEKCKCGCEKSKCEDETEDRGVRNKHLDTEIEEIKDKERENDLDSEIKEILKMYEDLMETIENNEPDFYAGYDSSTAPKPK